MKDRLCTCLVLCFSEKLLNKYCVQFFALQPVPKVLCWLHHAFETICFVNRGPQHKSTSSS